jgi:AcrR family transcriptional regulator
MAAAQTVPAGRDLRRELLDAAAALIAESGPGAVSLREIARRCGVSHAAPAHHFADRAALLAALATEGFQGLADALTAAGDAERGDATARLMALGRAYVTYAAGAPGHFPVMFRPELVDCDDVALLEARMLAFRRLEEAVAAAQGEGWAAGATRDAAVLTAWTSVHGLATLWLDGALPPPLGGRDLDALALAVCDLVGSAGGVRQRAAQAGSRRDTGPPIDTT